MFCPECSSKFPDTDYSDGVLRRFYCAVCKFTFTLRAIFREQA